MPNGVVTEYGYDDSDRVSALSYRTPTITLGTLTYGYDLGGERVAVGGTWARTALPAAVALATFDSANQLTEWNYQSRQYDANGSLASDGATSYLWNSRQRFEATSGVASASFAYDANGRRITATVDGATTQYLYDGYNTVFQTGGAETATLISGGGLDEWLERIDSAGTKNVFD